MSRDTRALVSLGGVAGVVCCIGPILAVLGAIGAATAISVAMFGIVGVGVALLAVPAYLRHRRRSGDLRATDMADTVEVPAPTTGRPR